MANQTEKKYIGGFSKEHVFEDGSSLINLELDLVDLQSCAVDNNGRIRLTVTRRRTPDKAGNTHSVYENSFKPKAGAGAGNAPSRPQQGGGNRQQPPRYNNQRTQGNRNNSGKPSDDLPF